MEASDVTAGYLVATVVVLLSAVFMFPPFLKEGDVENAVKQAPLKDLQEGFSYIKSSVFSDRNLSPYHTKLFCFWCYSN